MRHRIACAALLAFAGCTTDLDAAVGDPGDPTVTMDTEAVLNAVAAYRDSSMFDHVSKMYPSALGSSMSIELYASRDAASEYAKIAPEVMGSGAKLPVGSILVREVLDASGVAQKLTVMAKGPAGYNPEIGDWFWAVTDLKGMPLTENGAVRAGQLADCYGCHIPRATDDYLFGVPMIDRDTGTMTPPPPSTPTCGNGTCESGETKKSCPQDCKPGN